ncbi:Prophage CP4-57 regulatory protein (AlpA) [compost metagenome]
MHHTPTPKTAPQAYLDPFFTGHDGLPMGFARPKALARYLGISVPTLYRWEREGLFPKRNKMPGVGCTVWRWSDVHAWTDASVQTPQP